MLASRPRIDQLRAHVALVTLGAALVLIVPFANYGAYIAMLLSLFCLLALVPVRERFRNALDPFPLLVLAAYALICLSIILSLRVPEDAVLALDHIPLVLSAGLYWALLEVKRDRLVTWMAHGALTGVVLGVLVGLFQLLVEEAPRADGIGGGAIQYGNFALMLGFIALAPLLDGQGGRRYLLAGPLLGILAALLSGSRGSILVLAGIAPFVIWVFHRAGRLNLENFRAAIPVVALAVILIAVGITLGSSDRIFEAIGIARDLLTSGETSDISIGLRLDFYKGGIAAIAEGPWHGYGPRYGFDEATRFMSFYSPDRFYFIHLHNDIINFGVFYGVLGFFAYAAIAMAPVANFLKSKRHQFSEQALFVLGIVTITLFISGLTDVNFVYEAPKVMFLFAAAGVAALAVPEDVSPRT